MDSGEMGAAMLANEGILARFFNLSSDMLAVLDVHTGRLLRANAMFRSVLGWPEGREDLGVWWDLVHPDDLHALQGIFRNLSKGHSVLYVENRLLTVHGQAIPVRWRAYPEPETGRVYLIARSIDEDALHDVNFQTALDIAPTGVLVVDVEGRILYANDLVTEVVGYSKEELIGQKVEILLPESLGEAHEAHRRHFFEDPYARPMGTKGLNLVARCKDGRVIPVDVGLSPIHTLEGWLVVTSIINMTLRHEQAARYQGVVERLQEEVALLRQVSGQDALTSLANRRALMKFLELHVHMAHQLQHPMSLAMLDIDDFKTYNDTHGHPAGDEVLRTLGDLLRAGLRSDDLAARYGGEEFTIVMPHTDMDGARRVVERLRQAVAEHPWPLRPVTVSIGMTTYRPVSKWPAEDTIPQLILQADEALYAAKRAGKNRVVCYADLYEDER